MKQKSGPDKAPAERVVKDIRRQTRRQYSAEEKIRIVLEGLRGEENISELRRREGIAASMYYGWSKEFLRRASVGWRGTRRATPKTHWRCCLGHGGIAPVRQSDRLVEFSVKARARRLPSASSGKERYLTSRALASIHRVPRSVGSNARIAPLLLPTPQRRVRYFRYWHIRDMPTHGNDVWL